jgi:hypothetical protein
MSKSSLSAQTPRTENNDFPFAKPWWFHSSPLSLDDPLAPLPKAALDEGTWKPFSTRDCRALEAKWSELPDRLKRKEEYIPDGNRVVDELAFQHVPRGDETKEEVNDANEDDAKVIVGVERLHHVDLITQR